MALLPTNIFIKEVNFELYEPIFFFDIVSLPLISSVYILT